MDVLEENIMPSMTFDIFIHTSNYMKFLIDEIIQIPTDQVPYGVKNISKELLDALLKFSNNVNARNTDSSGGRDQVQSARITKSLSNTTTSSPTVSDYKVNFEPTERAPKLLPKRDISSSNDSGSIDKFYVNEPNQKEKKFYVTAKFRSLLETVMLASSQTPKYHFYCRSCNVVLFSKRKWKKHLETDEKHLSLMDDKKYRNEELVCNTCNITIFGSMPLMNKYMEYHNIIHEKVDISAIGSSSKETELEHNLNPWKGDSGARADGEEVQASEEAGSKSDLTIVSKKKKQRGKKNKGKTNVEGSVPAEAGELSCPGEIYPPSQNFSTNQYDSSIGTNIDHFSQYQQDGETYVYQQETGGQNYFTDGYENPQSFKTTFVSETDNYQQPNNSETNVVEDWIELAPSDPVQDDRQLIAQTPEENYILLSFDKMLEELKFNFESSHIKLMGSFCMVCNIYFLSAFSWVEHLNSVFHKEAVSEDNVSEQLSCPKCNLVILGHKDEALELMNSPLHSELDKLFSK